MKSQTTAAFVTLIRRILTSGKFPDGVLWRLRARMVTKPFRDRGIFVTQSMKCAGSGKFTRVPVKLFGKMYDLEHLVGLMVHDPEDHRCPHDSNRTFTTNDIEPDLETLALLSYINRAGIRNFPEEFDGCDIIATESMTCRPFGKIPRCPVTLFGERYDFADLQKLADAGEPRCPHDPKQIFVLGDIKPDRETFEILLTEICKVITVRVYCAFRPSRAAPNINVGKLRNGEIIPFCTADLLLIEINKGQMLTRKGDSTFSIRVWAKLDSQDGMIYGVLKPHVINEMSPVITVDDCSWTTSYIDLKKFIFSRCKCLFNCFNNEMFHGTLVDDPMMIDPTKVAVEFQDVIGNAIGSRLEQPDGYCCEYYAANIDLGEIPKQMSEAGHFFCVEPGAMQNILKSSASEMERSVAAVAKTPDPQAVGSNIATPAAAVDATQQKPSREEVVRTSATGVATTLVSYSNVFKADPRELYQEGFAALREKDFDSAKGLFNQALTIYQQLSPGSKECANCYFSLALSHEYSGNLVEAQRLCETALELAKANLGPEDDLTKAVAMQLEHIVVSMGSSCELSKKA